MNVTACDELELRLPETTPLVTIIGGGAVGTALAGRLTRVGVPVAALYGRTQAQAIEAALHAGVLGLCAEVPPVVRRADITIVAVSDKDVARVAQEAFDRGVIVRDQVVLHTAGAWAGRDLLGALSDKVVGVGTLHPLASLSGRRDTHERLIRAAFAIEGDPMAVRAAGRLVTLMQGTSLPLVAGKMPLYHAGAAIASNLVVALIEVARRALEAAGVAAGDAVPALASLLSTTADNVLQRGLPQALTGPVARGDVDTVKRHLVALHAASPDVADLYRRLGLELLSLTERRAPRLDSQAVVALRGLFSSQSAGGVMPKGRRGGH